MAGDGPSERIVEPLVRPLRVASAHVRAAARRRACATWLATRAQLHRAREATGRTTARLRR